MFLINYRKLLRMMFTATEVRKKISEKRRIRIVDFSLTRELYHKAF